MFMNVACPYCGRNCRVPESALGQAVKCSACAKVFQCGSLSPRSLQAIPLPTDASAKVESMPEARSARVKSAEKIHYRCPRCKKALESPRNSGGTKINCPDCGQRLQVPVLSADDQVPVTIVPRTSPPAPKASGPKRIVQVGEAPAEPAQRENCLECGMDISQRKRIQTCPDCGSLFCSAGCYREHRYHAHARRG